MLSKLKVSFAVLLFAFPIVNYHLRSMGLGIKIKMIPWGQFGPVMFNKMPPSATKITFTYPGDKKRYPLTDLVKTSSYFYSLSRIYLNLFLKPEYLHYLCIQHLSTTGAGEIIFRFETKWLRRKANEEKELRCTLGSRPVIFNAIVTDVIRGY